MEEELTPGDQGKQCRHNGENPEHEIACDACDYYLECFPEWDQIQGENGLPRLAEPGSCPKEIPLGDNDRA